MKLQMKSQRQTQLFAALFLSLTMLVTSCSKQEPASKASAPANEPVKAKPFEGQIFRTADDRQAITLISLDELEMRGGDVGADNLICKYTKQDDTLRVVKTMLGTTVAVYFKITPGGLTANDGTVLWNPAAFLAVQARILASSLFNSGNAKSSKGDLDGAIADFDRALELDPKDASTYNVRGNAKSSKGDLDGAIADFTRTIELDPKYFGAYSNRGNAKSSKGDLDGAIADFDRALELDPKDASTYNVRGYTYMLKGDYERAIQDCSHSIELNETGNNPFAYNNRGWAYCKKRDYDRAWADVKKCRELGGKVDTKFLEELTKASGRTE